MLNLIIFLIICINVIDICIHAACTDWRIWYGEDGSSLQGLLSNCSPLVPSPPLPFSPSPSFSICSVPPLVVERVEIFPRDSNPITAGGCMDTQGQTVIRHSARLLATLHPLSSASFYTLPHRYGRCLPVLPIGGPLFMSRLRLFMLHGLGHVTRLTSRQAFWAL